MAKAHAVGVPMAVPDSCSQVVFLNAKTLFFITISRIWRNKSEGKSVGRRLSLDVMKSLMAWIPMFVSMLVYIDLASAENNKAFSGRFIVFRS